MFFLMTFLTLCGVRCSIARIEKINRHYCSIVHSLFDLNIVSGAEPGERNRYHIDVIDEILKRKVLTEIEINKIQKNNVQKFMLASILRNSEPSDVEVNQCYLDASQEEDIRCKHTRIYHISRLYYHDVRNLFKYFKSARKIHNSFDLYVHWIELADFYLLHPDVTAMCPQPNTTKCAPPIYQPEDRKNYRLVFRPICYYRINVRNQIFPLKMDATTIYNELYVNESKTVVQDRWFRLAITFSVTNGLKEEVKRLCLLRTGTDFCFIEPMVSIYKRYLSYKRKKTKSAICRSLLMFSFEDFVLARTRPKLIDFWINEWKPGSNINSTEFEFINDIFPLLFEFIRSNRKTEIVEAMKCLVYPLRITETCSIITNGGDQKCMFSQVINKIYDYIYVDKSKIKIIDTSINLKEYVTYFKLHTFDDIETDTIKLKEAASRNKIYVQKSLHKHFKILKKFFKKISNYSKEKERTNMKYIENRLDDYIASSEIDSKRVAIVLDTLINSVTVLNPDEKKSKWGKALIEALNPMAKLSKKSIILESFDFLHDIMLKVDDLKVPSILKQHIYNVSNAVYHTKLAFFKNRDLVRFVKTNVRHSNGKDTHEEFARNKALFLRNCDEYVPWITKEHLSNIEELLLSITELSCKSINKTGQRKANERLTDSAFFVYKAVEKALVTCKTAEMDIRRMIETFKETYDFQRELLQTFSSYMRAKETNFAMRTLKRQVDERITADWYQTLFISLYARLTIYFEQLIMIDRLCDLREYEEFGVRPAECFKYPPDMDIDELIHTDECKQETKFVQIPTSHIQTNKDEKGFLNLGQLFEGNEVLFQVPGVNWLLGNKWISQRTDSPMYLTRFEIYLPIVSDESTEVIIKGRLAGNNVLHINDTTEYIIRPTAQLNSKYLEGTKAFSNCPNPDHLIKNPYRICPKPDWDLPMLCLETHSDKNTSMSYGSIYAKWKFTLSGYEGRSPVFINDTHIKALATICLKGHDDVVERKSEEQHTNKNVTERMKKNQIILRKHGIPLVTQGRTVERSDVAVSQGQYKACCEEGFYFSHLDQMCRMCPPGFHRHLKGYSCMRNSS